MAPRESEAAAAYDLANKDVEFRVADAGLITRSFATDVDISADGRAAISGYLCNDTCQRSEAYLQVLDEEGKLVWETSTGVHVLPVLATHAIRWSPANDIIIVSNGTLGSLAIGTFGEVYAGGSGESGFPVFVIVHD
ncbi:MAG TPA: hypothetical protein ENJ18_14080 [Nannocystis exedens]|nr:hypothetical protein [Nannocystis exedens]